MVDPLRVADEPHAGVQDPLGQVGQLPAGRGHVGVAKHVPGGDSEHAQAVELGQFPRRVLGAGHRLQRTFADGGWVPRFEGAGKDLAGPVAAGEQVT